MKRDKYVYLKFLHSDGYETFHVFVKIKIVIIRIIIFGGGE